MRITLILLLSLGCTIMPAQDSCRITYISNEGFLLEAQGKKVLIDGLFEHIDGNWCDSPTEQNVALMEASVAPFDNIDLIAITHKHRDHFRDRVVINNLLSNQQAMVICPNQVAEGLASRT